MPNTQPFESTCAKRSVKLPEFGRTSLSLEDGFWNAILYIADQTGKTAADLVAEVDVKRRKARRGNLSSALRIYVLDWALDQAGMREVAAYERG